MPPYLPRAERLDLSFPLTFANDGDTVPGSCLNVSLSGLFARFVRPLDLWTTGRLRIEIGGNVVHVEARVARALDHEAGLAFLLHTDAERQVIRDLVAFAESHTHLTSGRPPF